MLQQFFGATTVPAVSTLCESLDQGRDLALPFAVSNF